MALTTQRVLNRSTLVLLERLNKPLVTLASIAATIVLKCDSLYFVRFLSNFDNSKKVPFV